MPELLDKNNMTTTEPMYCVKCRTKVIVSGPKLIEWPNNRNALEGVCPHCKTKTYKIVKKSN